MDELKPTDKITTVPFDSIVKVPISGAFYARLQQSFFALLQDKMPEDPTGFKVNAQLKELQTREPEDRWEELVTLHLAIIYGVEESGKEQGILKEETATNFIANDSSPEASPES